MAKVHINIASNNNRCKKIRLALEAIKDQFSNIVISSIYQSRSQLFTAQDFYNVGINADINKNANVVKKILKQIENSLGRSRSLTKQNKITIDLDLILFDNLIDNNLDLPSNNITKYAHILAPLAEINADTIHPIKGKNFKNIWEEFKTNNNNFIRMYNINLLYK